ncbi:PD-(D/E)XK motif protein [Polaribacter sp. SA4-12]|uniref:PD-(D/E)XK motif protein n=1 Tax=Polaribacter sp. SA4-12 TaxID=1312072 RepID=UPI000B3C8D7D|nr:PD-(D/E)XK motif protein [Polaribacter sp. SA4-12]ARV14964.1 hypothetical protein BTO07_07295 [Polaribacter sp. SA4-12]
MNSIFKIFQELKKNNTSNNEGFAIASLPKIKKHKIGLSVKGLPLFFINSEIKSQEKVLDINLSAISIHFNQKCSLVSSKKIEIEGVYTIIALKTSSVDLQEYFLNIIYLLVLKLPEVTKLKELKVEIENLISLFNRFTKLPIKTIQGLWSELLVIEQSKNPEYLINSWHVSPSDKFDFNDGIDKIEVKSTSKSKRIHTFSLEQLNPNNNSKLIIASLFTVETGMGKTIFDLLELIAEKIYNKEIIIKINQIILNTLGCDFEKSFDKYFDYHMAIDSLAFYDSKLVPKIDNLLIGSEISRVHFDSDLSKIKQVININEDSLLHLSLIN